MSVRLQTCRLCNKANYEDGTCMVRIGTRHSVHVHCKMDRLKTKEERAAWLFALPLRGWQREQLLEELALDDACGLHPGLYVFVRDTFAQGETAMHKQSLIDSIRPGDLVSILVPAGIGRDGQEWREATGRAVFRGTHGWVLNMGGAHGTPGVATAENVTRVRCDRRQK